MKVRLLLPLLPLVLAACGSSDDKSEPTGQVVARVAGEDITIGELNAELSGTQIPAGVDRAIVEKQALQAIVERRLLANEAKQQEIDKNPNYLLQQRRTNDLLLVQLLRDKIANAVPRPSRAEAEKYIADNPTLFSGRRLYVLDQIQFGASEDEELIARIRDTKTMDELEQLLLQRGLEYRRTPSSLDTISAPVEMAQKLTELPAGEVFVIRQGPTFVANRIVETRSIPFSGEKAIEYAQGRVRSERVQEKLTAEAKSVREKSKDNVVYQAKYNPDDKAAPALNPAAPNEKGASSNTAAQ